MKRYDQALLFLMIGTISIGFSPIFVRWAGDVSPFLLAFLRTGFAVLICIPIWYFIRYKRTTIQLFIIAKYSIFSGVCLGLHFILWITSLSFTSVASAIAIVNAHPIFMIFIDYYINKTKLSWQTWGGVLLACSGVISLGFVDIFFPSDVFEYAIWGNLLALAACILFIAYIQGSHNNKDKLKTSDFIPGVYMYAALVSLVGVLLFSFPIEKLHAQALWAGLGLALIPQLIGHSSMHFAVRYISPTLVCLSILGEVIISIILAWWIFMEVVDIYKILSISAILIGVLLAWWAHKTIDIKRDGV